jgi:hypothetical protein
MVIMKREEAVKVAQYMGFGLELNSDAPNRSQFMRFRHSLAPNTPDFAVVIWCEGEDIKSDLDFYSTIESSLIMLGKYLKVKQFKEFIS